MSDFASLASARYLSIETFRRDGRSVRTPVWVTGDGDKLYIWTIADTGKVKRIRHNPRVRLASSTARGDIRGDWVEGSAKILQDREALDQQMGRMRAKYGLLFLPFQWWPRLTRTPTCVLEIAEAGSTA